MRRVVGAWTACLAVAALTAAAAAAPVTFFGTVSYGGTYGLGDTLYVSVVYMTAENDPMLLGSVALPRPSPRPYFIVPFVIDFDNATAPDSVLVVAILDEDGTGVDPDSLDNAVTEPDILGWFDGGTAPARVDASVSQGGLHFALPEGEIRGEVLFADGQTWATVVPRVYPGGMNPKWANLGAAGPYRVIGLYAGDYVVHGHGSVGNICWGADWTCASPDVLTLGSGEIRDGVDLDFTVLALRADSWGRLKALYR